MYVNCLSNEIVADKYYLINPYDFIIGEYKTIEEARSEGHKRFKEEGKAFLLLKGKDLKKFEILKELPLINY